MDQVILCDKSLQERLQEYVQVLPSYGQGGLSVSQIRKEWTFYLELVLDPAGWQAVWKVPRLTCEILKIPFPTVVLVYIENVDFKELFADVKIIAVQDDLHLPERYIVPLIQLWPTKVQDDTVALDLASTANVLDMLRFFYNNLLMPWDTEDDDNTDWVTNHLESRLRLYYDMKNGVIPRATAEHLRYLLNEARRLQARRDLLEREVSDDEESNSKDIENQNVIALANIHIRMIQIRTEVELLENPVMRNILLLRQKQSSPKTNNEPGYWLVFEQGCVDEYIAFLNLIKIDLPTETVKFSSDLISALDGAGKNDTIILNEAVHLIKTTGALENGGTLRGISVRSNTVIATTSENVMLDFSGDKVMLQNLTLDPGSSQCAIVVRHGTVTLKNCKIAGDGKSSTHIAIIVLKGSKLVLEECDISGFGTAVVGNSGSRINISNCEFFSVNVGLKIYENCCVTMQKTTFRDCKEYGVCVESQKGCHKIGTFEVLKIIPDVLTKDLKGSNNVKGDVLIHQSPKLSPMRDLFSNPSRAFSDLTMAEEMEVTSEDDSEANNTVIKSTNHIENSSA